MADTKGTWDVDLQYAVLSDIGMRRSNNQDSYVVSLAADKEEWLNHGHLFMVADGMGAHAAGELASKLAVDNVSHLYQKHSNLSAPEALKRSVIETNAEINRKGQANEEFYNMGTTCSILTLLPHGAVCAQVGDSRVYRVRNNRLEQLTFDHSLVWEMRAAGQLPEQSELADMVPKNVITRSLGPYPDVKVDIEGPFPIEPGDVFLLCSDGLTGEVPDEELGPLLASLPAKEAAQVLVDLANLRGGPDNITVIVARVMGPQISTQGVEASPMKIGEKESSKAVNPMSWAILGASVLATGVMLALEQPVIAAISAMGALAAMLYVVLKMAGSGTTGTVVGEGNRFGKGPYTRTDCVAGKGLLDRLKGILDELHHAGKENNWSVDWQAIEKLIQKADSAFSAGDSSKSIRYHGRAISLLMEQLRTN